MSKKNGHTTPPYISRVHLKGYKSIINTKIDLHPDLNIIIGPNGSGKTNFLELLTNSIIGKNPETGSIIHVEFCINNEIDIWVLKDTKKTNFNSISGEITRSFKESIYKKGKKNISSEEIIISNIRSNNRSVKRYEILKHIFPISLILYTLPKEIKGLDNNLSVSFNPSLSNREKFIANINNDSPFKFISKFLIDNFFSEKPFEKSFLSKDGILKGLVIDSEVKRNLKKFSPIEDIKLQGGISIKGNGLFYQIDYIGFKFFVNDSWLTWEMLSDGTKRLFYIVSEITLTKGVCFIEEPEIGVHPNQYLKILTFLRESAEDKQIIMTTHRPRSLDILKNEELNRIILTRYDNEKGTKMRHLTKKEIKQAIKYRENEGSTSELWSFTGFFDEEEVI